EGVIERGAERIARAPKLRHVPHEAEGAGARKFTAEGIRLDVEGHALLANQRVSEVNIEFNTEAGRMRPQLAVAVTAGHADRLEDADIAPRHRQRDQTGAIDRLNEGRRAAVHDRHFRSVDLDD